MTAKELIEFLKQHPPNTQVFWENDEYMYYASPTPELMRMVRITQREDPSNTDVRKHYGGEEIPSEEKDPRGLHWDYEYFNGILLNS